MLNIIVLIICFVYCDGLTRYACLTQNGDGGGLGSSEEFEGGNSLMRGSLSCLNKPNTKILVTRIIQGYGNFRSCSNPDQSCDKEVYSDITIASQCDGRPSCFVQMYSTWLEKCNVRSDFIHVEYECVLETSMFDICGETTRTVLDTSVYVVSPNVFKGPTPQTSWKVCECIINSRYTEQIIADYIHSDIFAPGNQCSGNHVLIESKLSPNQTTVDKAVEVCGQRTVSNQIFRGSVRFTYENRRGSTDDGFLMKFRVPPLEVGAEISMHCGPIKSGGTFTINNQQSMWPLQPNPVFGRNGPLLEHPHRSQGPMQSAEEGNMNSQFEMDDLTETENIGRQGGPGWPNPSQFNHFGGRNWNHLSQNVWSGQTSQGAQWQPSHNWPSIPHTNYPGQVPRDPVKVSSSNPTQQSPRDPRIQNSPSAEVLGITVTPSKTSTNNVKPSPEINSGLPNNQVERQPGFIPWTNPKPVKNDFIPWPPVQSKQPVGSDLLSGTDQSQRVQPARQVGELYGNKDSTNGIQVERKLPNTVEFIGKGSKLAMTDQGSAQRKDPLQEGNILAYIIGGAGAGIIGLCSITIFFMYTRRRRQSRQKKVNKSVNEQCEEQHDGSVTYEDPTYVLPSDIVDIPRSQGHINEAYEDEYQSVAACSTGSAKTKQPEVVVVENFPSETDVTQEDTDDCVYDNNM